MSTVTVEDRFRCRRGTAAAWTSTNEVLLDSEIGLESDTGLAKVGDGTTAWNDLPYTIAGRVDLTGIADGKALVWDTINARWIVGSVGGTWGQIAGTLSAQTDLQTALDAKLAKGGNLSDVASPSAALANLGALALPDPGYISGLKMAWVSGTQVTVGTGAAYIQSAGSILQVPTAITVTCSGLTASTFYHLYLWNNAGTPAIEYSATAPASPYFGTASSKTGDTSRRYVGSVLTDSGSNVYGFAHAGNEVFYEAPIAGEPFAVAISTFPSATTVSCSGIVPVSGRSILLNVVNNDTTHAVVLGNSTIALSTSVYFELVGSGAGGTTVATHIPLDTARSFTVLQTSGASSSVALRVKGYTYER